MPRKKKINLCEKLVETFHWDHDFLRPRFFCCWNA